MSILDQADGGANPFLHFRALGYRRLVPIIPPDAELSPKSTIKPGARGKAVGIRGQDGLWRGFDWIRHETTEEDCRAWHAMGAGVGIKCGGQGDGTWLVAIDADTLDERIAAVVSGHVRQRFGIVPMRIGRAPKSLYVVRTQGPFSYSRVDLTCGGRIELLSDGRQFVASGQHPVTRQPYRWVEPLQPYSELPHRVPGELL